MNFRYDIGEKLDTTKFVKQANHYIYADKDNHWEFNFPSYRLDFKTSNRVKKFISASIKLSDIIKNEEGVIVEIKTIYILNDSRFNSFKVFDKFFLNKTFITQDEGNLGTDDIDECVQAIVDVLKICSKINNLKAFL